MSTNYSELKKQIKLVRQVLLPRRNDWRCEPGYIFPGEYNAWLADLITRRAGLEVSITRHELTLKHYHPIWQQRNLPAAIYFAVEGATLELERQLQEITCQLQPQSKLATLGFYRPYPIFDVWHTGLLEQLHTQLESRKAGLVVQQQRAIQQLETSPIPTSPGENLRKFWLPLGTAIILECEEQTLSRYGLWLKRLQTSQVRITSAQPTESRGMENKHDE